MRKRTILNKVVAFGVIGSIIISNVLVQDSFKPAKAECVADYVIQMDDDASSEMISRQYSNKIVKISQSTDILEQKNIISLTLTDSEAEQLRQNTGVINIEKDIIVKASDDGESVADAAGTGIDSDDQWNIDMIGVNDLADEAFQSENHVKVAVLDSGVTRSSDIPVKEHINLIPGEEEVSPMLEDVSGHGTSVASVINAQNNQEGITGVNPNAELYSVKILDDNKEATVSRVVEGLYWCIENDVNIINMSFGTDVDSELLHKAVKDANNAGILMIAAAGNRGREGSGTVEYPAAYPEVIAVGGINAKGEKSIISSEGEEMEIVAPGEDVPATGYFDEVVCTNGTSMAAAHITGVASLLWDKDLNQTANFIRGLLDASTKQMEEKEKYGYGIVDVAYAMDMYDEYARQYEEAFGEGAEIPANSSGVENYSEEQVKASWSYTDHANIVENAYNPTTQADKDRLLTVKIGVKMPDVYRESCQLKYAFHGLGNYVGDYVYMITFAEKYYNNGKVEALNYLNGTSASRTIKDGMDYLENSGGWNKIFNNGTLTANNIKDTNRARGNILAGFAIHIAMDAYAHSAGKKVGNVVQEIGYGMSTSEGQAERDKQNVIPARWNCAKGVGKEIVVNWFNGTKVGVSLYRLSAHTQGAFYMKDMLKYALDVRSNITEESKVWFKERSATTTGMAGVPEWKSWVH